MQDATSVHWSRGGDAAVVAAVGWTCPTVAPETAFAAELGGKDVAVEAYANHGRWIVECPDCCSAQLACPDDRRFMCNNCANVAVGGVWRPVTWPKNRDKIEGAIEGRPLSAQNWSPGETVAFLKAENKANAGGA